MLRTTAVIAGAFALACGAPEQPPGATVRDSAQIRIVSNRHTGWSAAAAWSLTSEPEVEIGVGTGDPEYELFETRGAILLGDQRIAVANGGQIRFYDRAGRHIMDGGGRGQGPGEFQLLSWMGRTGGDSIVAYDRRQRRITILDSAGTYVRDWPLEPRDRRFFPVITGRLSDGSFMAQLNIRPRGDMVMGLGRDSIATLLLSPQGRLVDTLGMFANRTIDVQMRSIGGRRMQLPGTLPFTPRTITAATHNGVIVGTTDHTEFRLYDASGELKMIVRNTDTFIGITSRDQQYVVDSLKERFADNLNNPETDFMIRTTAESRLPEFFPTYDSLAVDQVGNIWVEMFRRPGETDVAWDIYDPDGLYLGRVSGPVGFAATEIGDDYMLGIWTASDGTARVRKYGIVKP